MLQCFSLSFIFGTVQCTKHFTDYKFAVYLTSNKSEVCYFYRSKDNFNIGGHLDRDL